MYTPPRQVLLVSRETPGDATRDAMTILSYAKRLFSLDTLDTRFTRSSLTTFISNGPAPLDPAKPPLGLDSRDAVPKGRRGDSTGRQDAQPSNWNTPEFFFYYLVLIVAIPLMFKSVYDVSIRESMSWWLMAGNFVVAEGLPLTKT